MKIFLAIGLTVAILARVNLKDLGGLLAKIPLGWLVFCGVLYFFSNVAKTLQYMSLLDKKTPFLKTLYIVTIQNTITNFVAASAGIASLIAALKMDEDVKVSKSVMVFLVTKIMDLLFIGLFCGISSLFIWDKISTLQPLAIALLVGIGVLVLAFIAAILFRRSFVRLMDWGIEKTNLSRFAVVQKTADAVRLFTGQEQSILFGMVLRSFGSSFLFFVFTLALRYMGYRLFAIPLGLWEIVFITCIMQVISFIPINVFGGLGINEVSYFYLFSLFGVSQDIIPAFAVGLRILLYLAVLIALLYLPVYLVAGKINSREVSKS